MVTFRGDEYQLFFSNNLEPLRALNYADERFFAEFERLCGIRYRILSIIRAGWQEKFGRQSDIEALESRFRDLLRDPAWAPGILGEYEEKKTALERTLNKGSEEDYTNLKSEALSSLLLQARREAAPLDAMSNMLHLFSSLIGSDFEGRLKAYSEDTEAIQQNFVFYTQPIRESRYAKLLIPELPGRFALSEEDATLSSVLRIGAYIKDDVSALLEERGEKLEQLFKEIARRLNVTVEDLAYLTLEEISAALDEKQVSEPLTQSRKVLTVLFYPEQTLEIYEGDAAEQLLAAGSFAQVAVDADVTELKGQSASPGMATGRAIVVRTSAEAMERVETGDILIAPYTAPEYLPAMKRAVAIVTQTGGITSHAAIVSRELKIPCVIGIPDVTVIISSGDRIEVNASEGTVTILERA